MKAVAMTSPQVLAQWLRLRELREASARVRQEARRVQRDEARAALEAHRAEFASAQARQQDLAAWMGGAGLELLPQLACIATSRKAWLADRLERVEYALIDDQQALGDAERELANARGQWLRARGRTESARSLLTSARRQLVNQAELRAEREAEPAGHGIEGHAP